MVRLGWVTLLVLLAIGSTAAKETRIVFIAGDRSHASGEHEFRAGSMLLAKALNEQSGLPVAAEVVGLDWAENPRQLDGAAAVVIYADAESGVAGQWETLDRLAADGTGLMFMHYAVHPSQEMADRYQGRWIGGFFENGRSVNPHWVADLRVKEGHPVARGLPASFECLDEFYFHMRFQEDRGEVRHLATAVPNRERIKRYNNVWHRRGAEQLGRPQTLMWGIERPDGGRGAGFTGGHFHRTWAVDEFRTLVLNAIVWTAGMDVPVGGVKSDPLSEDDLNANLDDYGADTKRLKLPDPADWATLPPDKVDPGRER